jgi:pyrimidine operon attenuation protein/uracil phosphoribosyltransferase
MPLPDAETLLAGLTEQMRPAVRPDTLLVGIHTGGVWLAQRLHRALDLSQPLGTIDVSFYRDDYGSRGLHARVKPSEIPFEIADADVILVDDVLFTGRTIRAALDALIDLGRPRMIQLATLIDRGHRELPIRPDYVGKNLPTSKKESVAVRLKEHDGEDRVLIEEPEGPEEG